MKQHEISEKTKAQLTEICRQAEIKNKLPYFCIATTANKNNETVQFTSIRETKSIICGSLLIKNTDALESILPIIDGNVDGILVDVESKLPTITNLETCIRNKIKKTQVYPVRPNDWTADAAVCLLSSMVPQLTEKKVLIIGAGNLGCKTALRLVEHGCHVFLNRRDKKKLSQIVAGINALKTPYCTGYAIASQNPLQDIDGANIVIGATAGTPVISDTMIHAMEQGTIVLDAGNGTIQNAAILAAKSKGIALLCLMMYPGFQGITETLLATNEVVASIGNRNLGKFSLISGGIIGSLGDIIVDNVSHPTRILGIANGSGDVIPEDQWTAFKENINHVQKLFEETP